MRPSFRPRPRPLGDDGFSLVEAVVALMIATLIFTALAFALIGGAKSSLLSQQNQQAGDVLNKAVEKARALPYESLVMRTTDLDVGEATDATRTPPVSAGYYNPSNDMTSGAGLEPLVMPQANGGLSPHVTQQTHNGGTYTVRQYVTVPSDASGAVYKRLTVVVEWSSLGKERTRTYSTLVAATKRGLPLPDFKFTNAAGLAQCRNPGSTAVYDFTLKNNGARDAWNLTTDPATPAWTFYEDSKTIDTDGDGVPDQASGSYEAGLDAALTVNAGVASTGLLEPTTQRSFFGVLDIASAVGPITTYTLSTTFRATSAAQPTYWQELVTTTTVQSGACGAAASASPSPSPTASPPPAPTQPPASCGSLTGAVTTDAPQGTMVRYYPMNPDQPSNTTARVDMPLLRDAGTPPAAMDLYNYSTDLHAVAGRNLTQGTTGAGVHVASWTYGMPAKSVLQGKGEVTVWAAPADGSVTAAPWFRVTLEKLSSTGAVLKQLGTVDYQSPSTGWGCTGLRPFSVEIVNTDSATAPLNGQDATLNANDKLRLSVRLLNAVPVRLGYGTAAYPMTMTLPYKSGLG